MSNGNGTDTNDLAPGGRPLIASQLPKQVMGNLLWKYAQDLPSELKNIVMAPGQVYSGELQPSMTPGPNQLSVPEYALGLAGMGLGVGGAAEAAGLRELEQGGAVSPQFGVWHGTSAPRPFEQFDDQFMGSGEGTQYEGWGHYVAERPSIAESYKGISASQGLVPFGDDGFPLSWQDTLKKYYEPGSIIENTSMGGYDKVLKFNEPDANGNWSVDVQGVRPDYDKWEAENPDDTRPGPSRSELLNDPSMWTSRMGVKSPSGIEMSVASPYDYPVRNHSTYPSDYNLERMGNMKGWEMGQPGGMLDINVIPEKNEFLDLNTPWKDQDPIVQDRLTKAGLAPQHVDPAYHDIREDTYIPGGINDTDVPNYMTGRDLYNSWVKQKSVESSIDENEHDWYAGQHVNQAKQDVSKQIDEAGVPGFKFLDRPSRQQGPTLVHEDNLAGMPGGFLTKSWIDDPNSLSSKIFNVDDAVQARTQALRSHAKFQSGFNPEAVQTFNDAADWLEQEHAAGRFSLDDNNRTRNFVVVNPKNLQIRTWNGRELTPVDHDPFAPQAPDPLEGLGTPDPGFPSNFPPPGVW